MAEAAHLPTYRFEDYLALEQWSDIKHEYIDGVIVAMTGASKAHDVIVNNLQRLLGNHLRGTPCRVSGSDLKLHVAALNRVFYPDLMVICSNPTEGDAYLETDAKLIIEVLSDSTEEYDRTVKAQAYQLLPTLQEYLLVSQNKPSIHCYRRIDRHWRQDQYDHDVQIPVLAGELVLSMRDIYERLPMIET